MIVTQVSVFIADLLESEDKLKEIMSDICDVLVKHDLAASPDDLESINSFVTATQFTVDPEDMQEFVDTRITDIALAVLPVKGEESAE